MYHKSKDIHASSSNNTHMILFNQQHLFLFLLHTLTVLSVAVASSSTATKRQPLGQHAPPSNESIDTISFASFDDTVLRTYQQHNYPLIIRGAIRNWPAYKEWRDEKSLVQLLGSDTIIRAELSNKENPARVYMEPGKWEKSKDLKFGEST